MSTFLKFNFIYNLDVFRKKWYNASRRGASDNVTDSSVLSNPADAQNVSCVGLCGRDICPKSYA